jgi:hypothetical protein
MPHINRLLDFVTKLNPSSLNQDNFQMVAEGKLTADTILKAKSELERTKPSQAGIDSKVELS